MHKNIEDKLKELDSLVEEITELTSDNIEVEETLKFFMENENINELKTSIGTITLESE